MALSVIFVSGNGPKQKAGTGMQVLLQLLLSLYPWEFGVGLCSSVFLQLSIQTEVFLPISTVFKVDNYPSWDG